MSFNAIRENKILPEYECQMLFKYDALMETQSMYLQGLLYIAWSWMMNIYIDGILKKPWPTNCDTIKCQTH